MPLSLANGKWYLIQEVKVLIHRQWGGNSNMKPVILKCRNLFVSITWAANKILVVWVFFGDFIILGRKKQIGELGISLFMAPWNWSRQADPFRFLLRIMKPDNLKFSFVNFLPIVLTFLIATGLLAGGLGLEPARNMGDGLGHVSSYSRLPAGTWTINRMVDVPAIRESFVWLGVGVLVLVDPFCEKRESQNILHPFIIIYSWLTHVQDFFIPCCVQQYGARISNKQVWRYLCVTKLCIFEDRLIRIDLCLCMLSWNTM